MWSGLKSAFVVAVAGVALLGQPAWADDEPVALDKLPKIVVDAVKKVSPTAELVTATQESEDGELHYEVTIRENGKNTVVTVEEDGEIEELERTIDLKDLPKVVTDALAKKFPKSLLKSAEAVWEMEDGQQEQEYFEVQLETEDKQVLEVKIKLAVEIITE